MTNSLFKRREDNLFEINTDGTKFSQVMYMCNNHEANKTRIESLYESGNLKGQENVHLKKAGELL